MNFPFPTQPSPHNSYVPTSPIPLLTTHMYLLPVLSLSYLLLVLNKLNYKYAVQGCTETKLSRKCSVFMDPQVLPL